MLRICPNPMPWSEAYTQLLRYSKDHPCTPPSPPVLLILNGWAFSSDLDKKERWDETVTWARNNGCSKIINTIPDEDFYYVNEPISNAMDSPVYQWGGHAPKHRPSSEEIMRHLETLTSRWSEIVGPELARITRPLKFTGHKARRLRVFADGSVRPPWGSWWWILPYGDRRAFTHFRKAINDAIAPHEVDEIDFKTDGGTSTPGGP